MVQNSKIPKTEKLSLTKSYQHVFKVHGKKISFEGSSNQEYALKPSSS